MPLPTPGPGETVAATTETLEVASRRVCQHIRASVAGVLAAVPGPTSRPHELEKSLGLHKTLAWKIAKIVECTDTASIVQYLPGPGAVAKFLDAARSEGVTEHLLEEVNRSLGELDELIEVHAGDRDTFDMMLASLTREGRREIDMQYRKAGFRSTSYICGVQARTMLRSVMIWPGKGDALVNDAAVITACIELRRLRPDRPWVIYRGRPTDDRGEAIPAPREPIEPTKSTDAPFLSEFCRPFPIDVRRYTMEDGFIEDELLGGPVGNHGAVTCYTGEVLRHVVPRYHDERNRSMAQTFDLRTPCQTVIFDHLVPADLYGPVEPELKVVAELGGRPMYANLRSDRDRLDVFETVEYLGRGARVLPTPDAPRYEEVVQQACQKLGWDVDRLDVYRVRMQFPYVPITLACEYPLPEAPGGNGAP